jgi:tetratricopeptide (TPR) repeat protein
LLAELDLLRGDPAAAVLRLEPLLDRPGLREHNVTVLLPTLAWASLESGDVTRAQQLATEAIERMRAEENVRDLPNALRVHGMVLARQGRWEEAERELGEAVSLAHAMPYPYAEAYALAEWGRISGERGELEKARRQVAEALAIFQELGAAKQVDRAGQILSRL